MKSLSPLLFVPLLFVISNMTKAATDKTYINLEVTYVAYVKLIGTVVGATKTFSSTIIRGANSNGPHPTLSLGTLGLESSISGNCTLDFSSLYGFSLKHSQGNQRFTSYQLDYESNTIDESNLSIILPSCNIPVTSLDFTAVGKIKKKARAGIYSDTVTITVTTQ